MKKTFAGLLAVAAALALTPPARAQVCASFPTAERGFSFGAGVQLPEGADFGDVAYVEGSYNAEGPLSLFGGMTMLEGADAEIFEIGGAIELASAGAALGPAVSACPVVSLVYSDLGTGWIVPVGFGVGARLDGGMGVSIMPYLQPQLLIVRLDPQIGDAETSTEFGFEGGVMLGVGMFFVGGTIDHVFDDGTDPVLGLRAGIRI